MYWCWTADVLLRRTLRGDKEVLFCSISPAEWPIAGSRRVPRRRARWPGTTWAGGRTCLSRRVEEEESKIYQPWFCSTIYGRTPCLPAGGIRLCSCATCAALAHTLHWMVLVDGRLLHLVGSGNAVDAMCRKAHKTYINLT